MGWGLSFIWKRTSLKKMDPLPRITLWAFNLVLSLDTRVTSENSLLWSKFSNLAAIFGWNSSQVRENFPSMLKINQEQQIWYSRQHLVQQIKIYFINLFVYCTWFWLHSGQTNTHINYVIHTFTHMAVHLLSNWWLYSNCSHVASRLQVKCLIDNFEIKRCRHFLVRFCFQTCFIWSNSL